MTEFPVPMDDATEKEAAQFVPLDELLSLPEAALADLIDRIPPERLRWYETVYTESLERIYGHGEVGEEAELELIDTLLAEYEGEKKIPVQVVGRWVKVPEKIRQHVEAGQDLPPGLGEVIADQPRYGPIAAAVGIGLLILLLAFTLIRRATRPSTIITANLTATAAMATPTTLGPTAVGPTATPLALLAADRVIEKGEDLRDYYPVLLEVIPVNGESRVFVVQQKPVETADWDYSRDPDTASWVSGLVVRPVLGIPYTPENEAFLTSLQMGDRVLLRMSTGALLEFGIDRTARVGRQDTSVFRQVAPGVVIALLEDPGADRLVLYGSYPPGQELARADELRTGGLVDAAIEEAGDSAHDETTGLEVSVLSTNSVASMAGTSLPSDLALFIVDLRLQVGEPPLQTADAVFELVDATGHHHAPFNIPGSLSRYPLLAGQELPARSDQRLSIGYLIPQNQSQHLVLSVRPSPDALPLLIDLAYEPPSLLTSIDLDVMVLGLEAVGTTDEPESLNVNIRLFNPNSEPIAVNFDDVYTVFSPVAPDDRFPVGPLVHSLNWHPVTIDPEKALDLALTFPWDGSPYLGLQVGGFQYLAEQTDSE